MIDKKKLIRWLSLTAYFIAAFLLFLLLLFPFDRVKAKLVNEVRERTALDLTVSRISPRFFNSFTLTDVVLSDQKGKVLFESPSVRTSVSLFSLLRGMLSLDMKAKAYGGNLLVKAQQGGTLRKFLIDAEGLDISAYQPLKDFGLKLSGRLGGNVEMNGDVGKGRLWLKGLTSRELKIKGFSIPDLDFDQCWFEADIKGDRLTIKKLELDGKELKVQCLGDVVLRDRGTLNLTVKLKPSERLAQEQSVVFSLLKNKDADGYYQFSLGGTLADPLPRL
jgi:type II secretion system protein N